MKFCCIPEEEEEELWYILIRRGIWRWSKGGNLFHLQELQTRESILYVIIAVNKYWHNRKGWEKQSNTVKGARLFNLRHPRTSCGTVALYGPFFSYGPPKKKRKRKKDHKGLRFRSYPRTSLVRYDLNLAQGCLRLNNFAPLPVLDHITEGIPVLSTNYTCIFMKEKSNFVP